MKKISYKKLWKLLIDKNLNKQPLSQVAMIFEALGYEVVENALLVEKDIKYMMKQNYKDFVLEVENNTGSEYNAY